MILTAIAAPLLTLLSLFFYFVPKFHSWLLQPTLRFCTSSNGAFGIVLSIALLSNPKIEAWANVWERFWLPNGIDWGTGKEKGLSAAFCILLALGVVVDWALRRWLGECPDEVKSMIVVFLFSLTDAYHHRNGITIFPIIWPISPMQLTEPVSSNLPNLFGIVSFLGARNAILLYSLQTRITKPLLSYLPSMILHLHILF